MRRPTTTACVVLLLGVSGCVHDICAAQDAVERAAIPDECGGTQTVHAWDGARCVELCECEGRDCGDLPTDPWACLEPRLECSAKTESCPVSEAEIEGESEGVGAFGVADGELTIELAWSYEEYWLWHLAWDISLEQVGEGFSLSLAAPAPLEAGSFPAEGVFWSDYEEYTGTLEIMTVSEDTSGTRWIEASFSLVGWEGSTYEVSYLRVPECALLSS